METKAALAPKRLQLHNNKFIYPERALSASDCDKLLVLIYRLRINKSALAPREGE